MSPPLEMSLKEPTLIYIIRIVLGEPATVSTPEEQKSIFLRSFFPELQKHKKRERRAGNTSSPPAPSSAHEFPWKMQRDVS
jgi:hypothetical protein